MFCTSALVVAASLAPLLGDTSDRIASAVSASRAGIDIGFALVVGAAMQPGLARAAEVRPDRLWAIVRPLAVTGAGLAAVSSALHLYARLVDALPDSEVTISAVGRYIGALGVGKALAASFVLAVLAFVVAANPRTGRSGYATGLMMVGLVGMLPVALSGHSAHDGGYVDIMVVTVAAHVIGALCWVGGLVVTGTVLRADRSLAAVMLPRFSRTAAIAAVTVGISGVVGGAVVVVPGHSAAAILGSAYTWLLVAKAVGLAMILVSGARLRFVVIPRIVAGRPAAVTSWVAGEIALMGVVFGLAALLVNAGPPA
ncbi:MAG: hypothetical protein ABS81_01860 [Pseudonocardia sp. SCN 72-86]|nr:MAG: hypothetical protein ABS81_01860 [Pseudonocardia sp. SCN 72-86]